ncbi:hypothetical protein [Paracoccus sanguinis]|uniref:hypothetical protein n=1 Tax=Paracoccus sanguinis TaxID=1545044 RepID=UPI00051E09B0|nr:hypothetical protein [Paracoccus sanguinis]KGJ11628.1 hypothetical protein IX57_17615 [Paracoccus sanguinis]
MNHIYGDPLRRRPLHQPDFGLPIAPDELKGESPNGSVRSLLLRLPSCLTHRMGRRPLRLAGHGLDRACGHPLLRRPFRQTDFGLPFAHDNLKGAIPDGLICFLAIRPTFCLSRRIGRHLLRLAGQGLDDPGS